MRQTEKEKRERERNMAIIRGNKRNIIYYFDMISKVRVMRGRIVDRSLPRSTN